jgi:ribosomal protein S18 acetylase RimI-like enzyme
MDIALLPPFRGQGIGAGLLRPLLAEGADAGRSVSIHVEQSNPAMSLYRRLGFVPVGEHGVYILMRWTAPS